MGDFNVNIGDALPYMIEQFMKAFGADSGSKEDLRRLRQQQQIAIDESSMIQLPGFSEPIPFDQMFEPVKLLLSTRYYDPAELLETRESLAVMGPPGQGKTTVLHAMFRIAWRSNKTIPFLFTLRRPNTIDSLEFTISSLETSSRVLSKLGLNRFTLLVDGYDEISEHRRMQVSELLARYTALNCGNYILGCRLYYDIYNLKIPRYTVSPLDRDFSAGHFIDNIGRFLGMDLNSKKILEELVKRGFETFCGHPVLLTLVCLLKLYVPTADLPSDTVSLLTDSTNVLAFRWDLTNGTRRESQTKIGGHQRLNCLMRIASEQRSPTYRDQKAVRIVTTHLNLMHRKDVDPRSILLEIARFYGLFVPVQAGSWEFVHRIVQDYLAARFMVETGSFGPEAFVNFDYREAYAACLNPNSATDFLIRALEGAENMVAFHECMHNHAAFDATRIADPLVKRYLRGDRKISRVCNSSWMRIDLEDDWILSAPTELLLECIRRLQVERGEISDALLAACLAEYASRDEPLPKELCSALAIRLDGIQIVQVSLDGRVKTSLIKIGPVPG